MPHPVRHRATRRWRLSVFSLIPAVLALAGMSIFSYPTVAAWVSQYNQSQVVSDYQAQIDRAVPGAAEQLAAAHAYNDALSMGALLEANTNVPTGAGTSGDESLDYNSILSANAAGLMARLRIPGIDLDLPIYHGTSDAVLLAGLGHLQGTSLPVGGEGTRSVITGHRGLAEATMFTHLDKVAIGDTFTIEVFGEVLSYRVVERKVVEPNETEALRAEPGRDLVTLVTCTPLGINTHRILVTGERITPTPAEDLNAAGSAPDVPHFPWWALWLTGGTLLIALYLWRAGYPPRGPAPAPRGARGQPPPPPATPTPAGAPPSRPCTSGGRGTRRAAARRAPWAPRRRGGPTAKRLPVRGPPPGRAPAAGRGAGNPFPEPGAGTTRPSAWAGGRSHRAGTPARLPPPVAPC